MAFECRKRSQKEKEGTKTQNHIFLSQIKFLWVRCDFYKPRMVYARQTDDLVVKNIKKENFLVIYDVITQMTSFYGFLYNTFGFLVKIPIG